MDGENGWLLAPHDVEGMAARIAELLRDPARARAMGAAASPGWWDEFVRLSGPIGWVRASAAKALEYRNGAVVRLARELGLAAPANERLLEVVGFLG